MCACTSAQAPHLQGLDAAGDEVRNHAHEAPLLWVLRQESRSGPSLLQVLDDGQLSRGSSEGARGEGSAGDRPANSFSFPRPHLSLSPLTPRGSPGAQAQFGFSSCSTYFPIWPSLLSLPQTSNQPSSLRQTFIMLGGSLPRAEGRLKPCTH